MLTLFESRYTLKGREGTLVMLAKLLVQLCIISLNQDINVQCIKQETCRGFSSMLSGSHKKSEKTFNFSLENTWSKKLQTNVHTLCICSGLILIGGNCLRCPWSLPWCPFKSPNRNLQIPHRGALCQGKIALPLQV